jgi:surfactin synthase thioesterase subunit
MNTIWLPFAGGSQSSYLPFKRAVGKRLNMILPELPGRGYRSGEEAVTDIRLIVDDVFEQIIDKIHKPFIICGHSMGTLIGLLLTRKLRDKQLPLPSHLFFTGSPGPSARNLERVRYNLPTPEFIEELRTLQGSPDEVLNDQELMNYFLPILRADFQAVETYAYEQSSPLNIPITVITGSREKITQEQLQSWKIESSKGVDFHVLPGDHFFIFHHVDKIMSIVFQQLRKTNL